MAAFASCRRSGWVRLLVVILCALFIFATLAAPPAQALGVESVAVFGLASVLSAATAALGFKLASNEQGQATLQKMVQDFKTVAWATGFVLVGSKLNGLQHGMDYIKMQVQNGKTYLDERVFAWVQQWLAENGVYNDGSLTVNIGQTSGQFVLGKNLTLNQTFDVLLSFVKYNSSLKKYFDYIISNYPDILNYQYYMIGYNEYTPILTIQGFNDCVFDKNVSIDKYYYNVFNDDHVSKINLLKYDTVGYWSGLRNGIITGGQRTLTDSLYLSPATWTNYSFTKNLPELYLSSLTDAIINNNDTGLSGTDTLGKDVVDLTLDQVLEKLKEWAQDWFDAGADSATNAATGAQDLPLTVATGAATANPSIAEDGPLVWFPPFSVPIPNLRTGETDTKTVDQGKENASAAETSTVDVAENQSVIDSLVNWALSYISPDTGLFSKFPLCVPYDAYLLVTSSLGVDAVGSDSIFGASPGDLDGVVNQDIETYSDFQPVINIKHDFQLDGATYPIELTIDLTPWQPLVTFFREGMALLLVAELIGAEFKRIRGH